MLDMDANMHVGPAEHVSRDEHSRIEVVYHFLAQIGRVDSNSRELLSHRCALLDAFGCFDEGRMEGEAEQSRIFAFGAYGDELFKPVADDDSPAGSCRKSSSELKGRFYGLCRRTNTSFDSLDSDEVRLVFEARSV